MKTDKEIEELAEKEYYFSLEKLAFKHGYKTCREQELIPLLEQLDVLLERLRPVYKEDSDSFIKYEQMKQSIQQTAKAFIDKLKTKRL